MQAVLEPEQVEVVKHIEDEALAIYAQGIGDVISNQDDYNASAAFLKDIKAKYKEIEAKRKELVKPFQAATKNLNEQFKKPLQLLQDAEQAVKTAILTYEQAKEAERHKEQASIDREAEKKRVAAEERARKWADKGRADKAEKIIQKVVDAPLAVATPKVEKVEGVTKRDNWRFRIVNEELIPRKYLVPDLKRIGAIARAGKDLIEIPGVQIYNEPVVVSR